MNGKKLYIAVILTMLVIAALGAWAMIDGAISYQKRPLITEFTKPRDAISGTLIG